MTLQTSPVPQDTIRLKCSELAGLFKALSSLDGHIDGDKRIVYSFEPEVLLKIARLSNEVKRQSEEFTAAYSQLMQQSGLVPGEALTAENREVLLKLNADVALLNTAVTDITDHKFAKDDFFSNPILPSVATELIRLIKE